MYICITQNQNGNLFTFQKIDLENIQIEKKEFNPYFKIIIKNSIFKINVNKSIDLENIVEAILQINSEYDENDCISLNCFQNELQENINGIM